MPGTMRTSTAPARRAVVLGASTVMRGLGLVVDEARRTWGAPLDLLVASGYGRSYGTDSRVLGRTLPSLLDCGLWTALDERPDLPTAGLLTDVGNDILYGAPVERIVAWVESALERLRPRVERLVLTRLPLEGVDTLGALRYGIVRTLLFPSSSVTLDEARRAACAVDEHLVRLGERFDARLVAPDPAWYGLDPVHVRLSRRRDAWHTILAGWADDTPHVVRDHTALGRLRLRLLLPASRRFLGVAQHRVQPVRTLADGSRLSLY